MCRFQTASAERPHPLPGHPSLKPIQRDPSLSPLPATSAPKIRPVISSLVVPKDLERLTVAVADWIGRKAVETVHGRVLVEVYGWNVGSAGVTVGHE